MSPLEIKVALTITAILGLVPINAIAEAVHLCNRSPVTISIAVAYEDANGNFNESGWYIKEPGTCARFYDVNGSFYYYGRSSTKLARWLLQNPAGQMVWAGATKLCFHPTSKFRYVNQNPCEYIAEYKSLKLDYDGDTTHYLIETNHKHVAFEYAHLLARDLKGRMEFEDFLLSNPGRENPFQIGVHVGDTDFGVQITKVWVGMPAADEEIEPGDIIAQLDGYEIESTQDLSWVLSRIPFDRKTRVPMTIIRDGAYLQGDVEPLFYPFNHELYASSSPAKTFIWEIVDGIPLMFGNELGCGIYNLFVDGADAIDERRSPDLARILDESSDCADRYNRLQELHRIFHQEAEVAGAWAGLAFGVGGLVKGTKAVKGTSLAARSRFVGGAQDRKGSFSK